jgi:hypothetical protein
MSGDYNELRDLIKYIEAALENDGESVEDDCE